MNDTPQKKLDLIDQELRQLSAKQLELVKAHHLQNQFDQHHMTMYQHLFGQSSPLSDPDLDAIHTQICDLDKDKENYFKIMQAAASAPPPVLEKVQPRSSFYSDSIRKIFGAETQSEQYAIYASITGGLIIMTRFLFRSYHTLKAIEFEPESQERAFHKVLSRATEEQLVDAKLFARRLVKKGIRGIEDDVDLSGSSQTTSAQVEQPKAPQKVTPSAPKFEDFGSQDNSQKV